MIQPASFFSSITPVRAYNSELTSPGSTRPRFAATAASLSPLERITREPQARPSNLEPKQDSDFATPQDLQDFIDTVLTNGEFLPVTDSGQESELEQNNRFTDEQSGSSPAVAGLQTQDMAKVRAAATAWQQANPERIDEQSLPAAVVTYLNVQTGGTPALGLSLFA